MAVTEEQIAKVFDLLSTCPEADTISWLLNNPELGLSKAEIYEALHTLEDRGQVKSQELFGRDQ